MVWLYQLSSVSSDVVLNVRPATYDMGQEAIVVALARSDLLQVVIHVTL